MKTIAAIFLIAIAYIAIRLWWAWENEFTDFDIEERGGMNNGMDQRKRKKARDEAV